MIYIDNPAGALNDVSLQDVLAPTFLYSTNSIRVDNTLASSTVCPGGVCNDTTIFNQVAAFGAFLGDGDAATPPLDGDVASYNTGSKTIDFGNEDNPNNATLNIGADGVWVAMFTVVMQ